MSAQFSAARWLQEQWAKQAQAAEDAARMAACEANLARMSGEAAYYALSASERHALRMWGAEYRFQYEGEGSQFYGTCVVSTNPGFRRLL